MLEFLVAILATWRLSAALFIEDGPWDCFARLRYKAGAYLPEDQRGFWGKQLSCFWCCSIWAGLVCGILLWLCWYALVPLALSGAAILLSYGGRAIWREMNE